MRTPPTLRRLGNGYSALLLSLILPLLLVLAAPPSLHANTLAKPQEPTAPIPFSEIGAKATVDYKGDAIGITATADGATLRTGFQKLAGSVTRKGLRLESTDAAGGSLLLMASAVGRVAATPSTQDHDRQIWSRALARPTLASGPSDVAPLRDAFTRDQSPDGLKPETTLPLPALGTVTSTAQLVSLTRPGLVEEYSVSADGVRQDFIIPTAPAGSGQLSVELSLSGAKAEPAADGAKLTLAGSGRELAYSRLKVTDAKGQALEATLTVLSPTRLAVQVEDAEASYPVRIDPTFSDADWVSLNPGIPGANSEVKAAVVDSSGNLYIGGYFTFVGTVAANYIAKWNGSEWSALGTGMGGDFPYVSALAVSGSDLYASGRFTTAGGIAANHIAKWNGSAWSALSSGMALSTSTNNTNVSSLAVIGSDLYAGGAFTTAGGVSANMVAKWNGSEWSALGSGLDSWVYALAVSGGNLYAGGRFTMAGGTVVNRIAKWNGSEWSALSTGMNSDVYALAVSGSDLYAGGGFGTAGGTVIVGIAKWNGSAWSALGSGINSNVSALVVSGSNIYVGGGFATAGGTSANRIAKWNGSTWSALGSGMDGSVSVLAVIGSDLYAGGQFTTAGGVSASRIAKWNDSAWSALGSGMDYTVYALAVSGSDLYAGGQFTTASGVSGTTYIAKWNGSVWSALGSGMNNVVYALALNGSDLYAGGYFTTAGGVSGTTYIAKWNGSEWSALGTGLNNIVYALALSGGDIYAGGDFSTANGMAVSRIAKWNGSAWSALGSGMNNIVNALAVSGSDLYAGGQFTTAGGISAKSIAKWNGSAWSALGQGMNSDVYALAVNGNDLYAGGNFTTAGGATANSIAKWNGSEWSALGSGMNSYVAALTVSGNDLYAGGYFTTAGGTIANRIAKWDGNAWSALGSGMEGYFPSVRALAAAGTSRLYLGGDFSVAGTTVSHFIVQANLDVVTQTPTLTAPATSALTTSPVSVVFTLPEAALPGSVKLSFGPTQLTLAASQETAGTHSFSFNPANPTATAAIASGGAIADDLYTVSLSYQDALGNPAETASSTDVEVDTTAPTLSPVSIASNNANSTKAKLGNTVTVSFTANEDVQVPSVTLLGVAATVANQSGNNWTAAATVGAGTPEGAAAFSISASDLAGNAAAAVTATTNASSVVVDKTAPSLTLPDNIAVDTLAPNGVVVNFTVGATDALDASPLVEATPASGTNFPVGETTVHVTATDDAGNSAEGSFTVTVTLLLPAIAVRGNRIGIVNGDATPSQADGTDFGSVALLNTQVMRSFTISNEGTAALNLGGTPKVMISGANAAEFTITALPQSPVAVAGSTTFEITLDPDLPGLRTATVNIANNSPGANPYTFAISGYGALAVLRPQTIAFTPPATVYLGQSPLVLTATASSGLPVTLEVVSGPASVAGSTLTLTAPGTVMVQATQTGGSNYAAATAVTRSIVVKDTPTALTFLDLTQVYNGSPRPISTIGGTSPVITYKIGMAYGPTAPTDAGSYPVTVFDGAVTKTGTLVIAKAMLTVTPDDKRKFSGEANPALTKIITGFIGSDTESVFTKPVVLNTTANLASAGGTYPIKASGGVAANYTFNYQQGTLVVESFAGSYEALLVDAVPLPMGKLSLTVAVNSMDFTGRLYTATETTALSIKGKLTHDRPNEQATGTASTTVLNGAVSYVVTFTLPLQGEVLANVTRNSLALGSANDGRKLLALATGKTVLYNGAHTAVLEPATPAGATVPAGSGWATTTISTTGVITLSGKLGDGTVLTSALAPDGDSDPGYRLWVQPYVAARTQCFLAGDFTLQPHPTLATRRYVAEANLTWKKVGLPTDATHRTGFGPVSTVLMLDPWLPPVAAKAATSTAPAIPAITLAQRLGLTGSPISFSVGHSPTGSSANGNLPTSLGLSDKNVVSVLTPVTSPLNRTKWKTLTFKATDGTFTGSFELSDVVGTKTVLRPVTFSGVLRQPALASDQLIGAGHYLMPQLSGTERLTGEILFTRP